MEKNSHASNNHGVQEEDIVGQTHEPMDVKDNDFPISSKETEIQDKGLPWEVDVF